VAALWIARRRALRRRAARARARRLKNYPGDAPPQHRRPPPRSGPDSRPRR
jgi:hypothetical protein